MSDFSIFLISSPENFADEHKLIEQMFELGLEGIFARKPALSDDEIDRWKLGIDFKYHKKILNWRGSVHSFEELRKAAKTNPAAITETDNAILLSPIFDSISKIGYQSKFSPDELKRGIVEWRAFIKEHAPASRSIPKLFALGGIDAENINTLAELGFDGAAVLGAVWNYADPVEAFKKFLAFSCVNA